MPHQRFTHLIRLGARAGRTSTVLASLAVLVTIDSLGQTQVPPANSPPTTPAPMADPIGQLIADARTSFGRVKDCMGTLVKQERVNGQLQPEQFIAIRVRQQPFSVQLKWQGPKHFTGQEATYVAGKNNNQMRAKGSGLISAVGFVSMEPTDPRALKQSRHAITESGIGNLIERIARSYELERRLGPSQVRMSLREYSFQQRPCIGLETVRLVNNGQFYCCRTLVLFDKEMKLPIRFEAYDWPSAGNAAGDLLESYSYIDLKFNVGLTDAAFGF